MIKLLKDKKNIVIILSTLLFLIKIPQESPRFIFWILGGVALACLIDSIVGNFFLKKKGFANSAIISGFIVSGILDYHQPWYILLTFVLAAIISKHLLKFRGKHIFNPANFALFLATIFKIPLTWNIESNIPLIIIFGIYLSFTYRKLFHILGFLLVFSVPVIFLKTNPFQLVSWFFIFIMLIEPKTSGYGKLRGLIFGGICGLFSFLFLKFIPGFDIFVSSLFIANLFNPVLEKLKS